MTMPGQECRIADPVAFEARDRPVRHMLFLVAYDICAPNRLRQVAKVCEDFGVRVEKSVFECDLAPLDFKLLWGELEALIDPDEDTIAAYKVCAACADEIKGLGNLVRPTKRIAYIL